MKMIPTASQTVGPFFSIGLTPLYQSGAPTNSADAITISGMVFDGNGKPIPDAVLEFFGSERFARVPTSEDGTFSVILAQPSERSAQSGESSPNCFDVLVFMRGLLKPVYARMYFADSETLKNDPALRAVPADRIATLAAKPTRTPNRYEWNIFMQGKNETVFFEH